jgi:hypothetical protein
MAAARMGKGGSGAAEKRAGTKAYLACPGQWPCFNPFFFHKLLLSYSCILLQEGLKSTILYLI